MTASERKVRIAITNMTGARNRGSEALVQATLDGVVGALGSDRVSLSLHTEDPVYDRDQFAGRVERIVAANRWPPRQLLRGRFGFLVSLYYHLGRSPFSALFPAYVRDLRKTDLIIATGGDLFTSDYGYFDKDARMLATGIPVAMLAQTVGPFNARDHELFKKLCRLVKLCTVRETESLDYLKECFPELRPALTADVAFLLPTIDRRDAETILQRDCRFDARGRRLMAISVSASIASYGGDAARETYAATTASFINDMNKDGWSVILIPHVQESARRNNDLYACFDVLSRLDKTDDNVVVARPLAASDFKGIIGLCDVLVGARTHCTIASMSQGIPTVAIAYSRKAWGIMKDYYGERLGRQLTVDIKDMTVDTLKEAVDRALANGRTPGQADLMKRRAAQNFELLKAYFAGGLENGVRA